MSEHDRLQEEIAAYVAGRLDADTAARLERHTAECGECRELVHDWTTLARGIREGGAELFEPHPRAAQLIRYAERPSDADAALARHVATCATCELEVAVWREQAAAGRPARRVSRAGLYRIASLAAAAGLVLGLAVGVLFRGDGPSRGEWGGAVELLSLDPSLRGAAGTPAYALAPGQPVLPLVVLPVLPEGTADDRRFRFSVRGPAGEEVWSVELAAGTIRERLAGAGVVTLLVPAVSLEEGRLALRIRAGEDGEVLLEAPFEVRYRQSPTATNAPQ